MKINHLYLFLTCIAFGVVVCAQQPVTLPARARSLSSPLEWRLVGPAHMSGRVTDIAVAASHRHTIYAGAATGGVWKTVNNGTTWEPVFDNAGSASVGAVAVSPTSPDTVWVGTGEANASTYSSWGDGVYKSTDGGRNWKHVGLADSQHIGRIVIDPVHPDTVYVAALGHLWGPNPERGVFKTTNGGVSWQNVLSLGSDLGIVDLAIDPANPLTLYAAAWGRRSDRFDDSDSLGIEVLPGSGVYKTKDGGRTWKKLAFGLPADRVGRIGLTVAPSRPTTVYALVDRAPVFVQLPAAEQHLLRGLLASEHEPPAEQLERLRVVIAARMPAESSAAVVTGLSRAEQLQVRRLFGQGELDTGGGVFRSDDAGETWRRVNPINERAAYYSQIRVDPTNPDHVYALLVRTWESIDGGRTFNQTDWAFSSWLTSRFVHGDFHAMWIDPLDTQHLIVGTDGGLYVSYDSGAQWEANPLPIGQFVRIALDMKQPYNIYGGLQDNGCWGGPSATRHATGITDADWFKIITADGAYVQVDPTNPSTMYAESQYGNLVRVNLRTGSRRSIRPVSAPGEHLRFNYVAPVILSPHAPRTVLIGAQRLFRSLDRGNTWTGISPDLTKGEPNAETGEGATITTIAESDVAAGVLWTGSDDGRINVSRDGGTTWRDVSDRLLGRGSGHAPPTTWVSRIETSHFAAGTAYVSLDGHRHDDRRPWLYRTEDFGESWQAIARDLPESPIYVVREDLHNPDLLFVGNELGVWVSLDGGGHWDRAGRGLPTVPVHDLKIHPRDSELVAGTHGRGVWILDIVPLQQLTPSLLRSDAYLFAPRPAVLLDIDPTRNRGASGAKWFSAPNPYSPLTPEGDTTGTAPSGATLDYYLRERVSGDAHITVLDEAGRLVRELTGPGEAGLNRVLWDLRRSPLPLLPDWRRIGGNDSRRLMRAVRERPGPLVGPGMYRVQVIVGTHEVDGSIRVDRDMREIGRN